jgi:cytochrome b561
MAGSTSSDPTYSQAARRFHWWTVAFVLVQIPLGLYMAYRGNVQKIFDATTNFLYSSHKLLGMIILLLVLARLIYRLTHGAPPDEPTIEPWQKVAGHANHWGLYLLLIAVPIGGWIGVSLYPALDIFGWFSLPGLVSPDQAMATKVFYYHFLGALAIVMLVGLHVSAALFHYFIRKDGVLRRMLPSAGKRE